ncbi:hypothetical protein [Yeosuana sp.]|uniref:hypothetical protein n=1 Tax=Yeosuana sp. TaxID=2529388 RepID=UPI004054A3F0
MNIILIFQNGPSKPDEIFGGSSTSDYLFFIIVVIGIIGLILLFSYYEIKNRLTSPEKKTENLISKSKEINLLPLRDLNLNTRKKIIEAIFEYLERKNYYHYNHSYLKELIDKLPDDDVKRIYNFLTDNYK